MTPGPPTNLSLADFFGLVHGRRGHFLLESGYHSALWLDLDGLFLDTRRIQPFVTALATRLARHRIEVVCGPRLGGALLAELVAEELDSEFCLTERISTDAEGLYRARYHLPAAFASRVPGR